jgi:O-antigen/teichoic acid export membrane protein
MVALPLFNINKNFGAYFTGLRLQKRFAQQRILRWSIIILYVATAVFLKKDVDTLLWCFFVAEFVLLIFNALQLRGRITMRMDRAIIADNLRFGMKTYVAELISVLNASLDVILIGYFLTNAETGIYSFMVYFAKTLYVFPGIMMQNFSPIVSKTWATGKLDELVARMNSIRRVNRQVVTLQAALLAIAYPLVTMFIKQEFNSTFHLFILAMCGAYIYSLISWSGSMLIMTNKLNENILRTAFIIIASAACTLSLTYGFGIMGAAVAFAINNVIAFAASRHFIQRTLKISMS